MGMIELAHLDVEVDEFFWEDLVRRYAIEEQHEGDFIAEEFMEIPGADSTGVEDHALADALDLIKFQFRTMFKEQLIKKYRTGNEFQRHGDADAVFELCFRAAEGIAMKSMGSSVYSVNLMIRIEIYFWVVLQVMRNKRGEFMDKKHEGANVRMGQNLDLLDIDFSAMIQDD